MKYLIILILFVSNFFLYAQRGFTPVKLEIDGKITDLYSQSHALLVGVSDYDIGWPDLPGVINDIECVEKVLIQHGFNVVRLINPNDTELENAYKEFIRKYGNVIDARLLFYFAGHGYTLKTSYGSDLGYIIPINTPSPSHGNSAQIKSIAMNMEIIEMFAREIQSKHALFVFDACFSGSIFDLSRSAPEDISYKTREHVRQFITSGSANEEVPDKSIFREQFVIALTSSYADGNKDGYLTGVELGEFLQSNVIKYSKGHQHPQYGKIKNPKLDKGDFVFILESKVNPESTFEHKPELEISMEYLDIYGNIKIISFISGKLYVDGTYHVDIEKNTAITIKNLTKGTHNVKIYGSSIWEQVIEVKENETTEITADKSLALDFNQLMILIEEGIFKMGSNDGEGDEMPVHDVSLDAYYINKYEITNDQYCKFLNKYGNVGEEGQYFIDLNLKSIKISMDGSNYKSFQGYENYPVIGVTWFGANEFCKKMGGRLPTEAEWEYAANGGSYNEEYDYSGSNDIDKVAWYYKGSDLKNSKEPKQVGVKQPNKLGIFDMTGNVSEWCLDWYAVDYYEESEFYNPQGPETGKYKVIKGGSFWGFPQNLRISNRLSFDPRKSSHEIGFRCIKEIE